MSPTGFELDSDTHHRNIIFKKFHIRKTDVIGKYGGDLKTIRHSFPGFSRDFSTPSFPLEF